jgi:hypothetical protein
VLPQLISRLSAIDIFLHDSLHTYRNMKCEFHTVWPKLSAGGILLSDDVELNRAFEQFTYRSSVLFAAVGREEKKDSHFGVIIKKEPVAVVPEDGR